MSIPLKDSPFATTLLPCKFAIESEGSIFCTDNTFTCRDASNCEMYSSIESQGFCNNLAKSLKPQWIQQVTEAGVVAMCSKCKAPAPKNTWGKTYYARFCPCCGKRMYSSTEKIEDVEPGIYQHFKGRQYKVLGVGQHTETNEKFVLYQALYGKYATYIRPLDMFVEDIEDIDRKYRGPRFFRVDDKD